MPLETRSICPDFLSFSASAAAAVAELTAATTLPGLLDIAHELWCGPGCSGSYCSFLHYPRPAAAPTVPAELRPAARSRYNKDTAELFFLMGGDGYRPDIAQRHEVDLWPLLYELAAADPLARRAWAYADWSNRAAGSAAELVRYAGRDTLQWMANWCGGRYAQQPTAVHYLALSAVCDDICVPPLDMVSGRWNLYGRTLADLAVAMDDTGWGTDGVHAVVSLVRQHVVQYLEKIHIGLHPRLNRLDGVWDAVIYRTHTANTYGAGIVAGRLNDVPPVSFEIMMDAAICDAISMDLAKSALDVYHHDEYRPTVHEQQERRRRIGYHSLYLDLIDDLVVAGAPEALVHYGRSGFLFVQLQDRYHERRLGRRIPLRDTVSRRLAEVFGPHPPAPAPIEAVFHARPEDSLAPVS